ncbi:DUF2786 domain-containing protein [Neisseria sp. Ec49-e6-T10]|uniref:DUF2786 domain-containing protein n=1 Tax=Neisseria sp. Ec49-e6-T10 TaxID=3140744 RepID=UPI003EBE9AFB
MSTEQDKILAKIKKCLALSKSPNANEAAVALKQAQKLMSEYNITHSDVAFSDVRECHSNGQVSHKRPKWDWGLMHIIEHAFGCESFTEGFVKGFDYRYRVVFIGVGANPEIAAYTYNVLKRQLLKARNHYSKTALKNIVRRNKIARADKFCDGWISAIYQKVKDFAHTEHKTIIDEYIKIKHPDLVEANSIERKVTHTTGNQDRFFGAVAAENVDLHHGVNGSTNQALELKP